MPEEIKNAQLPQRQLNETQKEFDDRVLDYLGKKVWSDIAKYTCLPRLKEIIEDSENDSTVVKAIDIVLNRAFGRPHESVDVTSKGERMSGVIVVPMEAEPPDA